jgi:hypothetical protein
MNQSSVLRATDFLLSAASKFLVAITQPSIRCVKEALSLRLEQWSYEADHSCPSSANIKDA